MVAVVIDVVVVPEVKVAVVDCTRRSGTRWRGSGGLESGALPSAGETDLLPPTAEGNFGARLRRRLRR